MGPILLIIGTRPEAIKLAAVYYALKKAGLPVLVCATFQHSSLLQEVFDLFEIVPDFNLDVMQEGQDIFYLTQIILQRVASVFAHVKPAVVLVQGDTTSAMAGALAAFYHKIPVAHIEAGLRTGDIYAPFPEEINRKIISTFARLHFVPTDLAGHNLRAENVAIHTIFNTGNTVVDALRIMQEKLENGVLVPSKILAQKITWCIEQNKKLVVLTLHRRESFGQPLRNMLHAIKAYAQKNSQVFFVYPYHPNPAVLDAIKQVEFHLIGNVFLVSAVPYKDMIYLLSHAHAVVTDSGGIQEEAISLGKPVVVCREKTERMEGIAAHMAWLAGIDGKKIPGLLDTVLLDSDKNKNQMSMYGDGYAAEKIVTILQKELPYKDRVMKKVCVVGLGYIGLPTAIVAAQYGFEVIGYDIDAQRVKRINKGDPVIQEPGISDALSAVLSAGNLYATNIIQSAEFYIIAVPTPFTEGKKPDLSYVYDAVKSIAMVVQSGATIILESTVPVGTTAAIAQQIKKITGFSVGKDIFIAHCPERVLPGNILHELVHNARIIGGIDQQSCKKAQQFYRAFARAPMYLTDASTAELVKLIENSSRDVAIAFAHQVATMAQQLGLDPYRVIELANKHPRVNILNPTAGVGGHCIAVDPWFLIDSFNQDTQLLKAARMVNDHRPQQIINQITVNIARWREKNKKNCTLLLLGLTYKANVDDLRESPALEIARHFVKQEGIDLLVCEPHLALHQLETDFGVGVVSIEQGIKHADIVVCLVAHDQFKKHKKLLHAHAQVIDVCGLLHQPKDGIDQEYFFWPASQASENNAVTADVITEAHFLTDEGA